MQWTVAVLIVSASLLDIGEPVSQEMMETPDGFPKCVLNIIAAYGTAARSGQVVQAIP